MTIIEFLKNKGINVQDKELIRTAFVHSSYVNEHKSEKKDNERLEFMGDAVLQVWVSDRLFRLDPPIHEGKMTTLRSQLVCEQALATYSRELGLSRFLLLGQGEEKTGGRDRDSIIADNFEAMLGALYLDLGTDPIDIILDEVLMPYIIKGNAFEIVMDYKTKLQEYVQADSRKVLNYELLNTQGPSNSPVFTMNVIADGIVLGKGIGNSKKKAEQNAAKDAFNKLMR
jgi:ribonuclease-3